MYRYACIHMYMWVKLFKDLAADPLGFDRVLCCKGLSAGQGPLLPKVFCLTRSAATQGLLMSPVRQVLLFKGSSVRQAAGFLALDPNWPGYGLAWFGLSCNALNP